MKCYNEQHLIDSLSELPAPARVAFAALCAERILPATESAVGANGESVRALLDSALDALWQDVTGQPLSGERLETLLAECMALLSEEPQGWSESNPYAEDAVASVAYAIRTRLSDEAREAAWAARRAYEAADQAAIRQRDLDMNSPGAEAEVLSDPLVQAELRYQSDDLIQLRDVQDDPSALLKLRQDARRNAHRLG